jgi:hypothetical protein
MNAAHLLHAAYEQYFLDRQHPGHCTGVAIAQLVREHNSTEPAWAERTVNRWSTY